MPELFEHFKGYDVQATRREARQEGREEGKQRLLIEQICKKLRKQQSVTEIAAALEENEETIQQICDIAKAYAPDYAEAKIYEELHTVDGVEL